MSGRAKIPYASFKVTLHAIKPQFIPRQGFIGRILPRVKLLPNISAGSPWMPSRMVCSSLSVDITRVILALSCALRGHERIYTRTTAAYVPVGDKVAGISIYLRAKVSLLSVSPPFSPLDRRPAAKKKVLRAADSLPSPR